MSGWKLVPVEPTDEMRNYGQFAVSDTPGNGDAADGYCAMLSASPDPTTDEALVERVARVIAKMFNEEEHWDLFRDEALAAIRAMAQTPKVEEKP